MNNVEFSDNATRRNEILSRIKTGLRDKKKEITKYNEPSVSPQRTIKNLNKGKKIQSISPNNTRRNLGKPPLFQDPQGSISRKKSNSKSEDKKANKSTKEEYVKDYNIISENKLKKNTKCHHKTPKSTKSKNKMKYFEQLSNQKNNSVPES